MNIEEFRSFCLSLNSVSEDLPFNESTLVFKVGGKIFALTDLERFESINLKCDPEMAVQLREQYSSVQPGYHMNKKHWNTIQMNAELNDHQIEEMIRNSYELVFNGLPKSLRMQLSNPT